MIAALTRVFGFGRLDLAQDVVQDTFCRAVEVWRLRGVPKNPSAWLLRAAKNRAIDLLRRERTARTYLPALSRELESEWTLVSSVSGAFNAETIADDQLRMMFSCCEPHISEEAQVALILHLLCGFSAREIAEAFLSRTSAIEKRIARGKKSLANSKHLFDLADGDLPARLSAVQRALYLLFNEGYHGAAPGVAVRTELCREAMRLAELLLHKPAIAEPSSYALCALMWLHAARLPARVDGEGNLVSFFDQDRARWDAGMIAAGDEFLKRAAAGDQLTEYHIEAAIAALHDNAARPEDTAWERIVWLYDLLLKIRPSPVVALNRAIALAQHEGPQHGLAALRSIDGRERLASYPFYPAALAELEMRTGELEHARAHFEDALSLARNAAERHFIARKMPECPGK